MRAEGEKRSNRSCSLAFRRAAGAEDVQVQACSPLPRPTQRPADPGRHSHTPTSLRSFSQFWNRVAPRCGMTSTANPRFSIVKHKRSTGQRISFPRFARRSRRWARHGRTVALQCLMSWYSDPEAARTHRPLERSMWRQTTDSSGRMRVSKDAPQSQLLSVGVQPRLPQSGRPPNEHQSLPCRFRRLAREAATSVDDAAGTVGALDEVLSEGWSRSNASSSCRGAHADVLAPAHSSGPTQRVNTHPGRTRSRRFDSQTASSQPWSDRVA